MLTTYCLRFGKNNWIYHKLNNLVGLEFLCKCSQRKNQYFMDGWMWKCLPVEKKLAAWMNEGEHFFLLFSGSFILSVLWPSKRFPPPYLSILMLHYPWMSKNLYGACGSRIILIFVSKKWTWILKFNISLNRRNIITIANSNDGRSIWNAKTKIVNIF